MRKTLVFSLLVGATAFCLCGCASEKGKGPQTAEASQPHPTVQPKSTKLPKVVYPGEERLKVGMTMAEVVKAVGSPLGRATESDGSHFWTYNDFQDQAVAKYSPVNPKVLVLTVLFNRNGKVMNWYCVARNRY